MKCFADTNKGCSALKVRECDGCNFFKTQDQVEEGRRLVEERLEKVGRKIGAKRKPYERYERY